MVDVDSWWVSHFPISHQPRWPDVRACTGLFPSHPPAQPASQLRPRHPDLRPNLVQSIPLRPLSIFHFTLLRIGGRLTPLLLFSPPIGVDTLVSNHHRPTELETDKSCSAELRRTKRQAAFFESPKEKFEEIRRRLEHALPSRSRTVFIPAKTARAELGRSATRRPRFSKRLERIGTSCRLAKKRPSSAVRIAQEIRRGIEKSIRCKSALSHFRSIGRVTNPVSIPDTVKTSIAETSRSATFATSLCPPSAYETE